MNRGGVITASMVVLSAGVAWLGSRAPQLPGHAPIAAGGDGESIMVNMSQIAPWDLPPKQGPMLASFRIAPEPVKATPWSSFKDAVTKDGKKQLSNKALRKAILRRMVEGGKPVVVRDSPVKKWPAMRWTWESLSGQILNVRDVRNQSSPIFTLRADETQGGVIGDRERRTISIVDKMPFKSFLELEADPGQYLYYTAPLETWSPAGLDKDVHWKLFEFKDKAIALNSTTPGVRGEGATMPMLWLSHGGVTAQCHYDKSHNFFVQVLGRKRFILFPPSHHSRLYQHPALHVSLRQSQVDFERPDHESFPLFQKAKALEVILEPGDLLYLPPFWFHMVESLSLSLSVSSVSPSEQEARLAKAYWTLLPLKGLESTLHKVVGAQTYLVHVLSRAHGVEQPWKFGKWLYRTRYSYLYPEDGLFMLASRFTCYKDQADEAEAARGLLDKKLLVETAETVAKIINHESISKAVRQTWLGDYVEEIARWALGGPESVPLFITECLAFERLPIVEEVEGPAVMRIGEDVE